MRALPNMVVLAPADSVEAAKATLAMATDERPNYIRLTREATPVITTDNTPFAIGKAFIFRPGSDVTIVSTGTMTYQAMAAAQMLAKDYIRAEVIHAPTIKPLDSDMILDSAARTRLVVTAEEAQINGGLGGAVAELLSEQLPTPLVRVGVRDRFGESGKPEELLKHFGLTHNHIAMAAHHLLMNHRHQRTG